MDTYTTLQDKAEAQLTEKRSRFLAFVLPVKNEVEAKDIVTHYKKKYYDARHVCYAYVTGDQGEFTRANDDGEPSGTAGRPILNQIQGRDLTYVVAIVVRYFGGVKLGTGPLGVAYKTVVGEALDNAPKRECIITSTFNISVPYADSDTAMRFVREIEATITQREYTSTHTRLTVSVRKDDEMKLKQRLSNILSLQFIKDDEG